MRSNGRKLLFYLLFVLLILFLISASLFHSKYKADETVTYSFTENPISPSGKMQLWPDIFGEKAVWTDFAYPPATKNGRIIVYNLITNEKTEIGVLPLDSIQEMPTLYNDRIVWTQNTDEGAKLYLYLLDKQVTYLLSNKAQAGQIGGRASLYGDKIVWIDYSTGIPQITLAEISASGIKVEILTNSPGDKRNVDMHQKGVVWSDWRNGQNADIYFYDFESKTEKVISSAKNDQLSPVIFDDNIAWNDRRNDEAPKNINTVRKEDIYSYNLSTGQETQITKDEYACENPDISKNYIVWEKDGIFLYSLETRKIYEVSKGRIGLPSMPRIYNDQIIFSRYSEDNIQQIYLAKINISRSAATKIINQTKKDDTKTAKTGEEQPETGIIDNSNGIDAESVDNIDATTSSQAEKEEPAGKDNKSKNLILYMSGGLILALLVATFFFKSKMGRIREKIKTLFIR